MTKERMFDLDKLMSEVAHGLGFQYPQHFDRIFKQRVGLSLSEFKEVNYR